MADPSCVCPTPKVAPDGWPSADPLCLRCALPITVPEPAKTNQGKKPTKAAATK